MKKKIIIFLTILLTIVSIEQVSAQTLQDMYNELSALEKSYSEAKNKAAMTQSELNKVKSSIASTENQIKTTQNEITKAENDIVESEKSIEEKKEQTNQMLLYLQLTNNDQSYMDYIFEAEDYTDFIYRYSIITQMSDYNNILIEELNTLVETLETKKKELSKKQQELSTQKKELQSKYTLIQVQYKNETDESLNVADEIAAKKKLIKTYEAMGCKRNDNVNNCSGAAAVDGWVYPLKTFWQSSNYGWDENRYHYAVDLAVAEGNSVYAVGNGTVIYSGVYWKETGVRSCGGLVIQVKHTYKNVDYISVYMHMLTSNVKVGDKVKAGQVIGLSGGGAQSISKWKDTCTGGAHLHFTMAYAGGMDIYNIPSSSPGTTFDPVKFFPKIKGIGSRL